ncbi:hypothetical protein PG988_015478 [Apiospora saccharicola]
MAPFDCFSVVRCATAPVYHLCIGIVTKIKFIEKKLAWFRAFLTMTAEFAEHLMKKFAGEKNQRLHDGRFYG